jgi:hypothetical protein
LAAFLNTPRHLSRAAVNLGLVVSSPLVLKSGALPLVSGGGMGMPCLRKHAANLISARLNVARLTLVSASLGLLAVDWLAGAGVAALVAELEEEELPEEEPPHAAREKLAMTSTIADAMSALRLWPIELRMDDSNNGNGWRRVCWGGIRIRDFGL